MKTKRAQMDILAFAVLFLAIIIIAPIAFNLFFTIMDSVGTQFNAISNQSANAVAHVKNVYTGFFDFAVVSVFIVNVLLLLVSSFLVMVHPAFVVFFALFCMFTMIFVPQLLVVAEGVWGADTISTTTVYMPVTQFLFEHYGLILLIVMIITGIVMYAKLRSYQT